jgi:hypothetical protein
MNGKSLLLIGGAVLVYLLYLQKQAIGLLTYAISSVNVTFSGLNPVLQVNILIENVTNESFTISAMVGTLTSNGTVLGSLSSFTPITIPPVSQVNYPANITLQLIGLASDIVTLIQKGSGNSQTINFAGSVNANGVVAPFSLNYKIGI